MRELTATPDGDATHSVTGNFTIRGITQSVTFPANVTEKDGTLSIQGEVVLDRSQFDVKYGSGSFFDNLGDNLIHDNFTVGFNLSLRRNKARKPHFESLPFGVGFFIQAGQAGGPPVTTWGNQILDKADNDPDVHVVSAHVPRPIGLDQNQPTYQPGFSFSAAF